MNAIVKTNIEPVELWKLVIDEVIFYSEFKLIGDSKEKADKQLATLKRSIMNVANTGGTRQEALPLVYAYNSAITDIVSNVIEQSRDDFEKNKPVVVESIPAFMQRLKEYIRVRNYSYETEKTYLSWLLDYQSPKKSGAYTQATKACAWRTIRYPSLRLGTFDRTLT